MVAEPALGKKAGVSGVIQLDGHVEDALELTIDIHLRPGNIGREEDAVRFLIDAA
jgi:hypothetical protein